MTAAMSPETIVPPESPHDARRYVLPAQEILSAYNRGHAAQLVSGRSLYDLVADGDAILTVIEHLRRRARGAHGMATITYSIAAGLDFDQARLRFADERDERAIATVLRAHGLHNVKLDAEETTRVLRGIASLARTNPLGLQWADGRSMQFLIVVEFAEHLAPGEASGRTTEEIAVIELAHILGQSNALRESGNLVVFHGRDTRVDTLVSSVLHQVRLLQPGQEEKRSFLASARAVYPKATLRDGLTDDAVVRLLAHTPNRSLELRLRASERQQAALAIEDLVEQKSRDVVALSEETLTLLDTTGVDGIRLVGTNMETPLTFLFSCADGLLREDPRIPANILLAGPPSTGKTDLARLIAHRGMASAYEVHSPKHGIVGGTEARARCLASALRQWTPHVAFADEVTDKLPLERSDHNLDSGASEAVTGALLTVLSDESRRGRSLLIGTTNVPSKMSSAMRSRWTIIPVLAPLREDYTAIIRVIGERLDPAFNLPIDDIIHAANLFYEKGATPREMRSALGLALRDADRLTPAVVQLAAEDVLPTADRISAEYADLCAIRYCTSKRFLPWYGREKTYAFPGHLAPIVNATTGDVLVDELDARIAAIQPQAKV